MQSEDAQTKGSKNKKVPEERNASDASVALEVLSNERKRGEHRSKLEMKKKGRSMPRKKSGKKKSKSDSVLVGHTVGTLAWKTAHFFNQCGDSVDKFECKLCGKEIAISHGKVSNLTTHLKGNAHASTWRRALESSSRGNSLQDFVDTIVKERERKQSSSKVAQTKLGRYFKPGGNDRQAEVNTAFLVWAVHQQIPFYAFDSEHFKLFKGKAQLALESGFQMKESVAMLYSIVKKQVEARLRQCAGLTLSFDLWTSNAGTKYMVITYHGIIPETFEGVSHALNLIPVEGSAVSESMDQGQPGSDCVTCDHIQAQG